MAGRVVVKDGHTHVRCSICHTLAPGTKGRGKTATMNADALARVAGWGIDSGKSTALCPSCGRDMFGRYW